MHTYTSRVVNPRISLISSMLSTLVSGSSGLVLVRALAGDLVLCSWARKTLSRFMFQVLSKLRPFVPTTKCFPG